MRSDQGYTLLELLVVMAIISMIVAAAPAVYARLVPGYEVRQFANELAIHMRELRERARETGTTEVVQFAQDTKMLVKAGTGLELPHEMEIVYTPAEIWATADEEQLYFYPNGASNGGEVALKRQNLDVRVKIDWVSGAIEVQQ